MKSIDLRHEESTARRAARRLLGVMLVLALTAAAGARVPQALAAARVDLNGATAEQLAELPGIGEAKAQAIIAERAKRPFTSLEDLERVKGIGPHLITALHDLAEASDPADR